MATEDFFSSALRHFEDSSTLYALGRVDEAAYLAGYVIECGLKKLLEVHRGTDARGDGHDLRGMTAQALALAALLAPASARYRVDEIPLAGAGDELLEPGIAVLDDRRRQILRRQVDA